MTNLRQRKTRLRFETASMFQGRSIVAQAEPFFISVHLKSTRTKFNVPWDAVYTLGAKLQAQQDAETKKSKL